MANTFKNIVITPNIGNTADPKIDFLGGNTTANTTINLYVYPDANGTLSFEGSAGQLFSITNDLANLLFSVADVSGIPSLEVYANGLVSIAPLGGNVVLGAANAGIVANSTGITTSSNTIVNSNLTAALLRIANSTGSANLTATSLVIGATTIQTTNTILGGTLAANGGIGTAGQVLKSGGAGANVYWAADLNSGTVTSVSSGNGLTGGPITTTGTLSVQAGTDGGLVSNATGVWVLAGGGLVTNSTGLHVGTANGITVAADTVGALVGSTQTLNSTGIHVNNTLSITTLTTTGNITLGAAFSANGGFGSAGQVLKSAGSGANAYWAADNNSGGTVTSVDSGNGLTGGPITGSGTLAVGAGNGISVSADAVAVSGGSTLTVNTAGAHVNSTLSITTLTTSGNITLGGTFSANGGVGSAGQILTSGGTGNTYWQTITLGDITAVTAGDGLTGGGTSGDVTLNVVAANGITVAADSVAVTEGVGLAVNTTGVHVKANTGIIANSTGTFVNATYIGTISSNNASYLGGYAETSFLRYRGSITETTVNDTTTDAARTSGWYTVSYPGASDALLDIGGIGGSTPRIQFRFNYDDSIWVRAARDTETTWDSVTSRGKLLLHSSNFNSYAPTLTGTGASGSWGISITGSAASATTATTATNATQLDGVAAANYARTDAADSFDGVVTFNANAVLTKSLSANGSFGTAGQILTSGGSGANAYWQSITLGDITAVTAGDGLTGGGTSGDVTLNVVAANGITVAADSVAVTEGVGLVVNTTGVHVKANTGIVANSTGTFVNATYIGTISANNASFLGGTAAASFVQNTDSRTLSGNLVFAGSNTTVNAVFRVVNTTANVLFAAANGFVGVNSTAPDATLTVSGSANVSGVSRFAANVTLAGALQTISGNANFDSGVLFVDATNNRVGVNSTGPDAALTVSGTANVSGVTTFSANVLLRSLLSANGGFGSAGQVLTSAGTGANTYWATPVGGGYYKGAASAVGTLGSQGQNIFRINANTLNTSTTMAAGENAQATGPLTIASGVTLTVQTGARVSIV